MGDLPAERVMNLLADIVTAKRRMKISGRAQNLLQVTVRSRILRLRSDMTFNVNESDGLLHFRSASRVGFFDFYSNRKRMEDLAPVIRERLREAQLSSSSSRPSSIELGTTPSGATIRSTLLRSVKTVEMENVAEPSPS